MSQKLSAAAQSSSRVNDGRTLLLIFRGLRPSTGPASFPDKVSGILTDLRGDKGSASPMKILLMRHKSLDCSGRLRIERNRRPATCSHVMHHLYYLTMKSLRALTLASSILLSSAIPAQAVWIEYNFSGFITEADATATARGFGVGSIFTGILVYETELLLAGEPENNRGLAMLFLSPADSTNGLMNLPLHVENNNPVTGADRLVFVGEVDNTYMIGIELEDANGVTINQDLGFLTDWPQWTKANVFGGASDPSQFGTFRGSIQVPEPSPGLLLVTCCFGLCVLVKSCLHSHKPIG